MLPLVLPGSDRREGRERRDGTELAELVEGVDTERSGEETESRARDGTELGDGDSDLVSGEVISLADGLGIVSSAMSRSLTRRWGEKQICVGNFRECFILS